MVYDKFTGINDANLQNDFALDNGNDDGIGLSSLSSNS